MALERMTEQQLENRLRIVEQWIARADPKDLKHLNRIHERVMTELVRRDMGGAQVTDPAPDAAVGAPE